MRTCIECGAEYDDDAHNYGTDMFFCCIHCYTLSTVGDECEQLNDEDYLFCLMEN